MTISIRIGRIKPRYIFIPFFLGIIIPFPVLASSINPSHPQPFFHTQKRMIAIEPPGRRRLDTRKSQLSKTPLFPSIVIPFKRLFSRAHGMDRILGGGQYRKGNEDAK